MREFDPLPRRILNSCFDERKMVGGVGMQAPTKDHVGTNIPPSHVDHGTRGWWKGIGLL